MPTAARNKPSSGLMARALNFIGNTFDKVIPGNKPKRPDEVEIGDYAARSSLDNFQNNERSREHAPISASTSTSTISHITRSESIESWAIKPEQAEEDRDLHLGKIEKSWNVDFTGEHTSQDRELRYATKIDTDAIKKMQASHETQRLEPEQNNSKGGDLLQKWELLHRANPQLFEKVSELIQERVAQRVAEHQAAGSPDIAAKRSSDGQHLTEPKRSIEIAQSSESRPSSQTENTQTVKPRISLSASEQTKGARASVNVRDQSESQIPNTLQRKNRTTKMRR